MKLIPPKVPPSLFDVPVDVLHVVPNVIYAGTTWLKEVSVFVKFTALPLWPSDISFPTVVAPIPVLVPLTFEIVHDGGCVPCVFLLFVLVQGTQFTQVPSSKLPFGNCCAPAVPATASNASVKSCFFIVLFCVKRGLRQAQGLHRHGTTPLLFCC